MKCRVNVDKKHEKTGFWQSRNGKTTQNKGFQPNGEFKEKIFNILNFLQATDGGAFRKKTVNICHFSGSVTRAGSVGIVDFFTGRMLKSA